MTHPSSRTVWNARKRPMRIIPTLVSVLLAMVLATMRDGRVSGQTPAAQALGPYAADFLLRSGGELDGTSGNGQGALTLAAGSSITTASTTFAGWRGTMTMTDLLLFAAYKSYLSTRKVFGQPGDGTAYYWYGPDAQGYYFNVRWFDTYEEGGTYAFECFPGPVGAPRYWAGWRSSSPIIRCDNWLVGEGGWSGSVAGMNYLWSQFRGMDSIDPSTPTQQDANKWVRGEINGGRWASEIKPLLDAVIRPVVTSGDLQALGITGNPPFDQPPQARRIAIDAGHGPPDCPGTRGPTYQRLERDLVLEIAQQVAADFEARGHTTILTRPAECVLNNKGQESDSSLVGRVETAISGGAEIFVSIHLNGSTTPTRGTEIWYDPRYPSGASQDSLRLARLFTPEHSLIGLSLRPPGRSGEPGIKLSALATDEPPGDSPPGPFRVLQVATRPPNLKKNDPVGGSMPAVIDEAAFLNGGGDNTDEVFLESRTNRVRIANAIENAMRKFFP